MLFLTNIKEASESVLQIDKHLREILFFKCGELKNKKLWENTYIKKQIDNRKNGCVFTINDHIRGMVYSMLSSGSTWNRIEPYIDLATGRIPVIDEIFYQYDVNALLNANPTELNRKVKEQKLGTQYLQKQIEALVKQNIETLLSIQRTHNSIDKFYNSYVNMNDNLITLVKELSTKGKPYKFVQFGEALTAEYLKNVGYDIGKPDRHIRNILSCNRFNCSAHSVASVDESINIIADIAKYLNKSSAEVDYILWAYCAKGFGEICIKNNPKCKICKVKFCNKKEKL